MESISRCEVYIDVGSPLINIDRRDGRTYEEGLAAFGRVRRRDQSGERPHRGIASRLRLNLLRRGKNQAVDGYPLTLAQSFVAGKEMGAAFGGPIRKDRAHFFASYEGL